MMRSWTRRNGSSPLGSLSLDPRCGKIRADVNRQIIQKIAHTAEGGVRPKSLFGSGLAGLGLKASGAFAAGAARLFDDQNSVAAENGADQSDQAESQQDPMQPLDEPEGRFRPSVGAGEQ